MDSIVADKVDLIPDHKFGQNKMHYIVLTLSNPSLSGVEHSSGIKGMNWEL
jgi:hypothetical protein